MKLYVIAGEPSGDALGGALMAGLKQLESDVTFQGVGGPRMEAHGLDSLFEMSELSVMGLAEVLPKLRHLFRRRDEVVADILRAKPDALITIDSPDFCLRVARKLKVQCDLPTIHYVAPTVWAWRPKRAEKMRGVIDHVLALFPFEPPYMEAVGISCDFVGHPIAAQSQASAEEAQAFREKRNIADAPLVLALPGSRRGEVSRLAPVFGETLAAVRTTVADVQVVLPAAGPVAGIVRDLTANWAAKPIVLDQNTVSEADKRAAFRAADVALAASGTVSLELAAAQTPMVIAYDMNWISRLMMRRMLQIDTVTLVNLVSETRVIPEFLGQDCQADKIAPSLINLLQDETARDAQKDAARVTMDRLGQGGEAPGLRAARSVQAAIARLG